MANDIFTDLENYQELIEKTVTRLRNGEEITMHVPVASFLLAKTFAQDVNYRIDPMGNHIPVNSLKIVVE